MHTSEKTTDIQVFHNVYSPKMGFYFSPGVQPADRSKHKVTLNGQKGLRMVIKPHCIFWTTSTERSNKMNKFCSLRDSYNKPFSACAICNIVIVSSSSWKSSRVSRLVDAQQTILTGHRGRLQQPRNMSFNQQTDISGDTWQASRMQRGAASSTQCLRGICTGLMLWMESWKCV